MWHPRRPLHKTIPAIASRPLTDTLTHDRSLLERSLDGLRVGHGDSDTHQALSEARRLLATSVDEAHVIWIGSDRVFIKPEKGNFPMLGLEQCRVAVLDDWRFNEDVLSYNFQLLWFEGAPIVIARPQNEHSGHLK